MWFSDLENLCCASSCFNFFPEFLRGRWLEPNIEFTFAPVDGRPSVPAGPSIPTPRPGVRPILTGWPSVIARAGVVTWHLATAGLACGILGSDGKRGRWNVQSHQRRRQYPRVPSLV